MNQPKTSLKSKAKTIDEVIENLDLIIKQSINHNNYLGIFAYVYQRTTIEIKDGITTGRFQNPQRMEKFDVTFANLYIEAYQNFKNGIAVSNSWAYAFDSKDDSLALIQHILLGMNAHINLDLAVAAVKVTTGKEILNLKSDFMIVNQILAQLTNTIQQGLGKASFIMKLLDLFGFRKDEKIINFSIKKARDFAWINALELAFLDKDDRKHRIEEIDIRVLELSKMIKHPPGRFLSVVLKLISRFEKKDIGKLIEKIRNE